MEFRILGPLEIVEEGRSVSIASRRQRALLALLLIHANEPLSADRIVEELWPDDPPASGAKDVAFHVGRLRRALAAVDGGGPGGAELRTEPGGYVLRTKAGSIDAVVAERLCREGEALLPDDAGSALELLSRGLGLWRGDPLSDLADESFTQPEIARLSELRLRLTEDRTEAALALGRHAELVGELTELVRQHPYRERLRALLMLALYRSGRQAEALRAYHDGRRTLADELGIDPSPDIQDLEARILHQDPTLDAGSGRRSGSILARNPYKGLRPFHEHDAPDFFGREALVERLVRRLAEAAATSHLLVLIGPSGSGKSSVVRAGLVPAIRRGEVPPLADWPIAIAVPGAHPLDALAQAIAHAGVAVTGAELRGGVSLTALVERNAAVPGLLLVVDQLEELFWRPPGDDAGGWVLRLLGTALADPGGRIVVVGTLRADALDRALSDVNLSDALRTGIEVVGRLSHAELARAIVRPAESAGVEVDPGLPPRIVADVADRPGTLPLLQYALTELFDHGNGRRLTTGAFDELGGLTGAINRRAEQVFLELPPGDRTVAREVFLRLVELHERAAPTVRRASRAELCAHEPGGALEGVLLAFGRARLLSFDRDPATGEATVEPAHEALIAAWGRLATWIEEARDQLWVRRRLSDAVEEWEAADRDRGFLLVGSRLNAFHEWASRTSLSLSGREEAYVTASLEAERAREAAETERGEHERSLERRARRWLRAAAVLSAGVAVLAVGFAVNVQSQGTTAREQQAVAVSRELAAAALGNLATDAQLSVLLAAEAIGSTADRGFVTGEALDALHWSMQAFRVPYPVGDGPIAVRAAPDGDRGVYLGPVHDLVGAALAATDRTLTLEECRSFLHRPDCPPAPVFGDGGPLRVLGGGAVVPLQSLAAVDLGGTSVSLAVDLPAGISLPLDGVLDGTHVAVDRMELEAGSEPAGGWSNVDLVLTPRSGLVVELARERLLVPVVASLDLGGPSRAIDPSLLEGWAADPDPRRPPATPQQLALPLLASVEGVVWYRSDVAGKVQLETPRSWGSLMEFAGALAAAGDSKPWCLGLEAGGVSGTTGADWVEDILVREAGGASYERWRAGGVRFASADVQRAIRRFGDVVFTVADQPGGIQSALRTPADIAGLPLLATDPRCQLLHGSSTSPAAWPGARDVNLGAFVLPTVDPSQAGVLRGRVYGLALVHDRPEVRAVASYLLGQQYREDVLDVLAGSGLFRVADLPGLRTAQGIQTGLAARLARAIELGMFHQDASDRMPSRVGSGAFPHAVLRFVERGSEQSDAAVRSILAEIDLAWSHP